MQVVLDVNMTPVNMNPVELNERLVFLRLILRD